MEAAQTAGVPRMEGERLVAPPGPGAFPSQLEQGIPFEPTSSLPTALPGHSLLFSFHQGLTSGWFNGLSSLGPSQLTPGMLL